MESPKPSAEWVVGPVEPFVGDLEVHTFTFGNGLVLKVVPDRAAPVVAYQTWYGVGSADEIAGKTGLAHLFEHLMFKGTRQYADGEYMQRLEAMGADGLNAWTWLDQTVYLQAVPKERLDELAALESVRMGELVVDEGPFRSELDVVMNERRLVVDNEPDGKLSEILFKTSYDRHPYGWPTIGWMADLEKLEVGDAVDFYERFYAPDNATILVVGDVEPDEAAAVVARHYGRHRAARPRRPERAYDLEQKGQKREETTLPIAADRVLIGFKVPPYTHEDTPALLVLDAALTAGQTGRLRRALKDPGYVADLGASVVPLRDPTLYEIVLHGRPGVPAEVAEARLWEELARVREHGISDGELAMGIAQWEAHTLQQLEDAMGKASFLGWAQAHTGSHLDGLRRLEAIPKVTREDVLRVARAYLVPERSTVIVGRSDSPADPVDVDEAHPVVPSERVVVDARPVAGPSTLPAHELVETRILGARVLEVHDPTLPLVHLRLFFPAGTAVEDVPGVANLAGRMLLRGTSTRDRHAFEAALEQLGATLSVGADADGILVAGTSLASTWPAFVTLVAEAVARPAFDAEELRRLVQEVDNELAAIADEDGELASVALRKTLYGEQHPYGRDPRGTRSSIAGIGVEQLRSFHERFLRATGAIVGLAGGFDARIAEDVRALLEGVAGEPEPVTAFPEPAWPERRTIVLVDKPERSQTHVVMGQLGVDASSDDFAAFVLANDAFGVGFGGRLFKEIRVKNGWSYYAYSAPQVRAHGASWVLGMAPANEVAPDAVHRMLALCEQVEREGFSAEEVDQVRSARLNARPFLANTARKRLDHAMRAATTGYDRLAATERMATVDREQANAAIARVVEPERLVVVVVGTAEAIRESLEAKVGPVEVVPYKSLV